MASEDVPGAEQAWHTASAAMRAAHHLAPEPRTPESAQRLERRIAHLRGTDPGGSWVAVDDNQQVVGLSQAFVRDDLWVLSLLGVVPAHQERRTGKALLDAALTHAGNAHRGMILCSRDPRAARRYVYAGFDLHPAVKASGCVDRRRIPRPSVPVREGDERDREFVAGLDRSLRGGAHGVDVEHSIEAGCRLLVSPGAGYVVARGPKPMFLAATDDVTATDLLFAVLSAADPDETAEVDWITSAQQWAIRTTLQAGLQLHAIGPVMLRGFAAPPAPYLPSGGFG